MIYNIDFTKEAMEHLAYWQRTGQKKIQIKIAALLEELREHPTTGTGQIEQLKGNMQGFWSRRIDKGSRLVYKVEEDVVTVLVVSLKGHYGDK